MSTADGVFYPPIPVNEPVRGYAPGSVERESIQARLESMGQEKWELPNVIGGEHRKSNTTVDVVEPHQHGNAIGRLHIATTEDIQEAFDAAANAKEVQTLEMIAMIALAVAAESSSPDSQLRSNDLASRIVESP